MSSVQSDSKENEDTQEGAPPPEPRDDVYLPLDPDLGSQPPGGGTSGTETTPPEE